jgi:hypothetical protein
MPKASRRRYVLVSIELPCYSSVDTLFTMRLQITILLAAISLSGSLQTVSSQGVKPTRSCQFGSAFYSYKLRGEVRLLVLWLGRDNVGGGHIAFSRSRGVSENLWYEEIEFLFGSDPERIPNKINRWGYGRETSQWLQEEKNSAPRIAWTEFQGIMRRSKESSLGEALDRTGQANDSRQFLYDAILSRVTPASSLSEIRALVQSEEFNYRHPDSLLGNYREMLPKTPPQKSGQLVNSPGMYGSPYGFLTGLSQLIQQVLDTGSKPSLTYVYNSKLYTLSVLSTEFVKESRLRNDWKAKGVQQVSDIRFRCWNLAKKEKTDFELWIPKSGLLKGVPVRILLQPRWWLRLQLDLNWDESRLGDSSLL